MNNPNPFLPQGSFLEQKNKARKRLNIAVYFSISLSVVALMALLIQGCRKSNDATDTSSTDTSNIPQLPSNPPPDTNVTVTPAPDTNVPAPVPTPTPVPLPPAPEPVPPPVTSEDYTVIKGDTLAGIAKKSNVSLKALQGVNPGVDAKKLKIGQKLHLPPAGNSAPNAVAPSMPGTPDMASSGGEQTYKVKSGDTLTGIAKHFHVSIKTVQSANKLGTTSIKVGQVLKIPGAAASAPAPVPAPVETTPPPAPTPSPASAPSATH
jgi:LysM repeat protein